MVCDRGVNARINKSRAVQEAGGVGMVLRNTADKLAQRRPPLRADRARRRGRRAAIKTYVGDRGRVRDDQRCRRSSTTPTGAGHGVVLVARPDHAGGGDILKPDIFAPGQDILAAVAPPGNPARDFDLYSGTSMSSPHVAGLGALLKQAHPDWSPMAIKSALDDDGHADASTRPSDATAIFRIAARVMWRRTRRSIRASSTTAGSTTGSAFLRASSGHAPCCGYLAVRQSSTRAT